MNFHNPNIEELANAPSLPYWMYETSGQMADAVKTYFNWVLDPDASILTEQQIDLLKYYVQLWADYPWKGDEDYQADLAVLRQLATGIKTVEDINNWIDEALDLGIDPF